MPGSWSPNFLARVDVRHDQASHNAQVIEVALRLIFRAGSDTVVMDKPCGDWSGFPRGVLQKVGTDVSPQGFLPTSLNGVCLNHLAL